jgi:hypothetical protein
MQLFIGHQSTHYINKICEAAAILLYKRESVEISKAFRWNSRLYMLNKIENNARE